MFSIRRIFLIGSAHSQYSKYGTIVSASHSAVRFIMYGVWRRVKKKGMCKMNSYQALQE
jgi:hypothetical protein